MVTVADTVAAAVTMGTLWGGGNRGGHCGSGGNRGGNCGGDGSLSGYCGGGSNRSGYCALIKKNVKFSSYIRKFRVEQLHNCKVIYEEGLSNI